MKLTTNGAVVFEGLLQTANSFSGTGIWEGTPGHVSLVVQSGQQAPGTPSGTLFSAVPYDSFASNDHGAVVFEALLATYPVGTTEGIWAGLPGNLKLIAREADQASGYPPGYTFGGDLLTPSGTQQQSFSSAMINDRGQVVFEASIQQPSGGYSPIYGIFATDAAGVLHLIAASGETIQTSRGTFYS